MAFMLDERVRVTSSVDEDAFKGATGDIVVIITNPTPWPYGVNLDQPVGGIQFVWFEEDELEIADDLTEEEALAWENENLRQRIEDLEFEDEGLRVQLEDLYGVVEETVDRAEKAERLLEKNVDAAQKLAKERDTHKAIREEADAELRSYDDEIRYWVDRAVKAEEELADLKKVINIALNV